MHPMNIATKRKFPVHSLEKKLGNFFHPVIGFCKRDFVFSQIIKCVHDIGSYILNFVE